MKTLVTILFALFLATSAQAATPTQTATFNLAWTDNSAPPNGEDGFHVETGAAIDQPFLRVATTAADATSFVYEVANDPGNKQYCFRIDAFNSAGQSAYSNVACATSPSIVIVPGAPSGVTVSVTVTVSLP